MPHRLARVNLSKEACFSNGFIFKQFRTLTCNGALATPLPSTTSALFAMQWRGCLFSETVAASYSGLDMLTARTCKFCPLFSITCRMLLSQPFSFQAFALLPGGGCRVPVTVRSLKFHLKSRRETRNRIKNNAKPSNRTGIQLA